MRWLNYFLKDKTMYNCYNEAVKYLQGKYGTKEIMTGNPYGKNGKTFLVDTHKHPYTQTPDGKSIDKMDGDDKIIECLLNQYFYGIPAQQELYFKLVSMGIMQDKENRC